MIIDALQHITDSFALMLFQDSDFRLLTLGGRSMKNRTVLLYMTFVFLSNFSTILYFLTVYLEFVGFSMVAISSMMIAYQVSKFILEVPTGYIADRFGRKTSGLVGVVGMLG